MNLGVHQNFSADAIRIVEKLSRKLSPLPLVRPTEHRPTALLLSKDLSTIIRVSYISIQVRRE